MNARLVTRCNCVREMEIPFPPQKFILVPLRWQTSLFHLRHVANDNMNMPRLGVRRFDYMGMAGDVAEYLETSEQWRRNA